MSVSRREGRSNPVADGGDVDLSGRVVEDLAHPLGPDDPYAAAGERSRDQQLGPWASTRSKLSCLEVAYAEGADRTDLAYRAQYVWSQPPRRATSTPTSCRRRLRRRRTWCSTSGR